MTKNAPPNIFYYLDYRKYLKDYFTYQKRLTPGYSLRNFARLVGLPQSNTSFFSKVLGNKRNLSQNLRIKLAGVLKLKEREKQYFENLVQFCQAKTMEEKNHFFSRFSKFKESKISMIIDRKSRFFSKWYYAVIWNYIGSKLKSNNVNHIAQNLFPSITPEQVKESITLLSELNLIKKMANGYKVTEQHISTEKEVRALFTHRYLEELIKMSIKAFESVPTKNREFYSNVFSISKEGFKTIKERTRIFQEEMRDIINKDQDEDRIYTMTMQLYPNTKIL